MNPPPWPREIRRAPPLRCFASGTASSTSGSPRPRRSERLAAAIRSLKGWRLSATRFYTGIPDVRDNAFWNHFWTAKLVQMGRQEVWTFSRPLRYQNKVLRLPNGQQVAARVGQEKGIDIRIALDVVRLALDGSAKVRGA